MTNAARLHLGIAAALAALLVPCPSRSDDRPWSLGGSIAIGWDQNILGSASAEQDAFGTDDPDYWFEVDRLDDSRGDISFWAETEVSSFYKELRLRGEYRRYQHLHNAILGRNEYEFFLRQKLPDRQRIDLTIVYSPQVYLRHRADKDALPGDPSFRPEAYRATEIELEYQRLLFELPVAGVFFFENRDETTWFNERDRKELGGGLAVGFNPGYAIVLEPSYEYSVSRSRNKPDLGTDLSHRQHAAGLKARAPLEFVGAGARIEFNTKWKFRTYTTDDPEDTSRFQRKDVAWWWNIYFKQTLGILTPFVGFESSGKRVDLPPGANADTEEGEYDGSLVRFGMDWEI